MTDQYDKEAVRNKYRKILQDLDAQAPLRRPGPDPRKVDPRYPDWRTPDGAAPPRDLTRYRVNTTIGAERIAEILGIPQERVVEACLAGRLRPHMRDTFMELDVVELRERWDAGTEQELVYISTAAAELSMPVARARQYLVEHGVQPTNRGAKALTYPRAAVVSLAEELRAKSMNIEDSVDVYEVAEVLGLGVQMARQIVATWPSAGSRPAGGQGAPRRLYPRSYLDAEIDRRRGKTSRTDKVAALRAEFEARLASLDGSDEARDRDRDITDNRANFDAQIAALRGR